MNCIDNIWLQERTTKLLKLNNNLVNTVSKLEDSDVKKVLKDITFYLGFISYTLYQLSSNLDSSVFSKDDCDDYY